MEIQMTQVTASNISNVGWDVSKAVRELKKIHVIPTVLSNTIICNVPKTNEDEQKENIVRILSGISKDIQLQTVIV